MDRDCVEAAAELVQQLESRHQKIALAESCTAGRIAASLGVIPGVSSVFCGSKVIYRNASKCSWLNIPEALLEAAGPGPVSPQVSHALAVNLSSCTPESDISFAVTGDIGPNAPAEKDGKIFCCLLLRDEVPCEHSFQLQSLAPLNNADLSARENRLNEATLHCLNWIRKQLAQS